VNGIRVVICDLGRVILWFDSGIFYENLARRCGVTPDQVREAAYQGGNLYEAFDRGILTPEEFHRRYRDNLGVEIDREGFFEDYNAIFSLNRPVLDVLIGLKRAGTGLVLLSNTDIERFGYIRRTFPEILIFDDYVLSYELGHLKPEAEIYREAVRRAGCAPSSCLFIDDMEANVQGAVEAGLKGVLYTPKTDLAAELHTLGLPF
jgi:glucose-1-phosphatase